MDFLALTACSNTAATTTAAETTTAAAEETTTAAAEETTTAAAEETTAAEGETEDGAQGYQAQVSSGFSVLHKSMTVFATGPVHSGQAICRPSTIQDRGNHLGTYKPEKKELFLLFLF